MSGTGRLRRVGYRLRSVGLVAGAVALLSAASIGAIGTRGTSAQDSTPAAESPATVTVSGIGMVIVAPDTASVVVGVNIIEPTLGEAQAKATTQMTAVIEALKAAGIAEKDIQTVNYSVNIIQDYDQYGNPATIRGFQVSNQVNVIVRDLDQLGSILDTVVAQGANAIWGISFYVDDPSSAATQARTLAVQNAKQKAEELAAAAGLLVGRVISITESYSPGPMPVEYDRAEAMDGAASVPIQTGTSTISASVQVTFELQ